MVYTQMHGFTLVCMVLYMHGLHIDAWFYTREHGFTCSDTLTHGFTQVCMVLYMHSLHIDAWFYTREHGFIHPTYEILHEVT